MNRRTSAWAAAHAPTGARWGRKTLALLLSLVLCLSLLPAAALAADDEGSAADAEKAIQLGTGGITGYADTNSYDYIYFGNWVAPDTYTTSGPIKWRVLDDQTNTGAVGLFLLSETLLGTSNAGGIYFQQSYHYVTDDKGTYTYHKGNEPTDGNHATCQMMNAWQGSDARSWCTDFYTDSLSTQEQDAVLATEKSDEAYTIIHVTQKPVNFAASENILRGDKVFFLSAEEADNAAYGFTDDDARRAYYDSSTSPWWLRSPAEMEVILVGFYAGAVYGGGDVYGSAAKDNSWAARPAFNLNTDSVLFVSAAEGGKMGTFLGQPADNVGETLQDVDDYTGSEWKLTLKDSSRRFFANVNGKNSAVASADSTIEINYSGAQAGENEYVSAMLVDSDNTVLYYGRIAKNSKSGTAEVKIPYDLAVGDYTLKVFNEQCNGDYKTDYASDFVDISLTVTPEAYITIVDADGNEVPITPFDDQPDVLGDGTVSYTPPVVDSTKTYTDADIERAILGEPVEGLQPAVLTLHNANLRQIYFENHSQLSSIERTAQLLLLSPTVKLEGESTITSSTTKPGIRVYRNMIITGDGSLTVNAANNAIVYGVGGLYLQKSGTVTLNAHSRGIYQGEPIGILFWGGKLTIQAGNADDLYSGAIAMYDGFDVADNASLWLGDTAETNCIRITPPEDGENWEDAINRQWATAGSENFEPHYLLLTTSYSVTLETNGGTIADGEDVTSYTYGEGAALPTPSRPGYHFDGWYTDADFSGDAVTAISATDSGDKTFYAKWTRRGSSSGSGSYLPSYTVTVEKATNGSVSADRKTASPGAAVTITVTPDRGYTLETLTVTDRNGNEQKLTNRGDGKYSFAMPSSEVTVRATFMDDNTMLNFFVDVKASDYYYDAVLWAAQTGVTAGTDAVHFSPDLPCTRAQIVTFLWRAAGSPLVNYAMNMTDVSEDAYYAEAVRWALSEGVATGTSATTFGPNETCTRAQAVAFLFRYAAPEAVTLQELVSGFSDAASVPGYALPAMNWALAEGIVQGDGSKLLPNDSCTRAQIVTFLYRALEK